MLTLVSALCEMFGVQLYKNNARVLLLLILSILNLDWLQHTQCTRSVWIDVNGRNKKAKMYRALGSGGKKAAVTSDSMFWKLCGFGV